MYLELLVALGLVLNPAHCEFFDPMELYVGASEGVALSHTDAENKGAQVYDMFSYHSTRSSRKTFFGLHDDNFEVYQMKSDMNKMEIRRTGVQAHTYHIDLTFWDSHDIKHNHEHVDSFKDRGRYFRSVPVGDGSIALQCANHKYLRWDSQFTKHQDPCTSAGICDKCKFYTEIGSINPFFIEIVKVEWGDPVDDIIRNPSTLATDTQENYSDVDVSNTFRISYTDTTTDTTTWEKSWGFEFSTSLATTVKLGPISSELTIGVKTTYNGKEGGSNTETDSTTYDKSATYPCPARHRCEFKLIGRHLDNAAIPFTATVRKTDGSKDETWKEHGMWYGVKTYDTSTEYRTEALGPVEDMFNKSNLPNKMETEMMSTEIPEKPSRKPEDVTQPSNGKERVTSNINPPKRIRPDKQNKKKEVFDQMVTESSVSSSKPSSLFCFVIFTFLILSWIGYHEM